KENFFVYAADVNASLALKNVSFAEKSIVILGSEGKGIRPNVLKRADERFYIPMYGKIDSLNVSQSATIVFYHMHYF
ncbi:MAG TPA: 23S rRNA (guanosine(2251)-2'-O)-methyltransferase RlmB, partial [Flexistipes sinusarabici]|nr:23S rRNA (guanosine(2251)-2'-O)-methyltransferase RlmB [Flexistipes sinusarabici]